MEYPVRSFTDAQLPQVIDRIPQQPDTIHYYRGNIGVSYIVQSPEDLVTTYKDIKPLRQEHYVKFNNALFAHIKVPHVTGFKLYQVKESYDSSKIIQTWKGGSLHRFGVRIMLSDNAPTNERAHLEALYMSWIASSGMNIEPQSELMDKIRELSPSQVWTLCNLMIPSPLIEQLSPTYAACFFALATGLVVPRDQDPTLNNEDWKLVTKLPYKDVFNLGPTLLYIYIGEGINVPTQGNPYTILLNPQIRVILDRAIEADAITRFGGRRIEENPVETERFRNFFVSIGSNLELYSYTKRQREVLPGKSVIESSFYGSLLYWVRQIFDIKKPRPALILYNPENDFFNVPIRLLSHYTDNELQEFYFPHFYEDAEYVRTQGHTFYGPYIQIRFTERGGMMNSINDYYQQDGMSWFRGNPNTCNNDNMLDIESGSLRGETRKEDAANGLLKTDPNLFYMPKMSGARRRCFRVSELMKAFRESQYGFEYLDPDWVLRPGEVVTSVIDPLTDKPVDKTLPIYVVAQLYGFLKGALNGGYGKLDEVDVIPLTQLLDRIKEGIDIHSGYQTFLNAQIALIKDHPEWRNDLLIYFGWLFLFAMWIRFWKGPGTPYPAKWVEMGSETCEYGQRDQHINIELSVHGNLIESLERGNVELANYLKTLPFLHYDWRTGEITKPVENIARNILNAYTVEDVIDRIQLDQFCMAQGTDILSGTAFIYLTEVLMVPRDRLSDLLVQVMKLLRSYEVASITSREQTVMSSNPSNTSRQLALDVISQHRSILTVGDPGSGFVQPPLDVNNITQTRHLAEGFAEVLTIE